LGSAEGGWPEATWASRKAPLISSPLDLIRFIAFIGRRQLADLSGEGAPDGYTLIGKARKSDVSFVKLSPAWAVHTRPALLTRQNADSGCR
jgi:hypothetical protein